MTRARSRARAAVESVQPLSALSGYFRDLDSVEPSKVAEWLTGDRLWTIGPQRLLDEGGFVAAVGWRDRAFKTFDSGVTCRGVWASWEAARASMLALAIEYETAKDLRS